MSSQVVSKINAKAPKPQSRLNSAFKQLWSIHWWMAACYLVLFAGGFSMVRMPENALQENAYTLHKSFGALTMGLLTLRIFMLQQVWWRKYTRRLPKPTGEWIRTVLLHAAIYGFMLAVPISGFFLSNSYQSGNVPFFWIATLSDIFPENAAVVGLARSLHFWIAYMFLGFIMLHAIDQRKYVRSLWRRATQSLKKVSSKPS
ncbi:cytochrome b/b6 domain-containing protein [Leptolyngbya sp. FACHB-16]|uniref:cytochrome b n=1 Tax=unclassified Leptolyngbya TaxID=2650499 RepID=UPI0016845835|nr:cytochrome b/b6 domain-containing protein [Leptolyngbya sp. FACHB-16]MBD2156556.1 cytochrome b [Leptolyngbya sp. FACHB-16]